jgi:hypothetical protein
MDVRAAFPTNRTTIYMDAICHKCGSVFTGKLEKKEVHRYKVSNEKIVGTESHFWNSGNQW